MVLLPIKPIVKSTRPTRETLKLWLKRSFLCLLLVIVVVVFDITFTAFGPRKAGVNTTNDFDLMKSASSYHYYRRGLIDSVRETILGDRYVVDAPTKEEIMNEVEEVEYERPSDESSEKVELRDIEEEEEEEKMESAKDEEPQASTTVDVKEEKEATSDVTTKDQEQEQEAQSVEEEVVVVVAVEEEAREETAASGKGREETEEEVEPRGERNDREQKTAPKGDEDQKPKSFVEFTAKDLEDVERFDYMIRKRDGSIGLSENQCQVVKTYFQETLKPRYDDLKTNKIVIIDWSENYQNGIGDEMQHYQELFIIGISTGRAAYVKTQKAECDGLGISEGDEIENSKTYEDLARKCQFDLGDYFIGYGDIDWKWDKGKRRRAKKELFDDGDFEETVFTWSQKGAYIGDEQPERYKGGFYAASDENSVVRTMEHPKFQAARVARIRIKTNFGHWCHPKPSDWGICLSYRWAINFENNFTSSKCGEGCGIGSCFGAQMLTPRKHLKIALLPPFEEMSRRGWKQIVGAHIRTGFADMSQVQPPTNVPRVVKEPSLASVDNLLATERTKRDYPKPKCPIKNEHRVSWREESDEEDADGGSAPMTLFLKCLADLMRDVRLKESDPLGLFFTTDSPAINAILHSPEALKVLRVNGTEVLSTVGSFGNVKFSNTGVCDDSSDSCVASDPRSAWLKSMVDMTLLGEADVQLLLYSSKFADAALMRSTKVKRGRTHFYENTRITHQLIDPLVSRIQKPNPSEEDWSTWGLLWDNFGPNGERKEVKGSSLARKTISAAEST